MADRQRLSTEERAELLAVADPEAVIALAEALVADLGDPVVVTRPAIGLVMVQVRDPVCDERFHLGEVVVTRAAVELAGAAGWSMRMGTDRVATLAAAVCDAVASSTSPLAVQVDELCTTTQGQRSSAADAEWREIAATEVRFEEMD